jgi:selenocysteine-specific elongation factor
LLLGAPAVTVWNQPFVIRSESPVLTLGGGHVLDPMAARLRSPTPRDLQFLLDLMSPDPQQRAAATLYLAGVRGWDAGDLPRTAGIRDYQAVRDQLAQSGVLREIRLSPTRQLRLHEATFQQLSDRIETALLKLHQQNPLRSTLDRWQLTNGFRYLGDDALLEAVLTSMQAQKRIHLTERGVALVGQGPKLSQNERKLLAEIVEQYRLAGFQAPTVKEVQQQATRNQQSVPQLVALAAADGDLVQVNNQYYLHADVERQARERLREHLADGRGLTLSEIREILDTSRKYAIPYAEFLDQAGFTVRQGDLRLLGERSA